MINKLMNFLKKKKTPLIFLVVGFFIGFIINLSFNFSCKNSGFKYISPNLFCEDSYVVKKIAYASMKDKLVNLISEKQKEGSVTDVSIYFRDLEDGPTLGIDEHDTYAPASLLKLPIFLTYLSVEDDIPGFLNTELSFQESSEELKQFFPPTKEIEQNKSYTLEEMIESMIKYSDNRAYYVLVNYIEKIAPKDINLVQRTFIDLGIITPKNFQDQTISVKSYASIFSQLYYSSFFSKKEFSERALKILADTDFHQGLVSGVPKDIAIAHKFGERSDLPNGEVQLHDCGIVYYPKNPYLLCVMTRGKDFGKLSETIGEVSKMVYEEFDSRKL